MQGTPQNSVSAQMDEKGSPAEERVEVLKTSELNLSYNEVDEEPSLHVRTYIALAAMFILNLVQMVALQGPPTFVRPGCTYLWRNKF